VSRSQIGKLIATCADLKHSVQSGTRVLAQPDSYFEEGDSFGITGVCRFELDLKRGEIRFRFGEQAPDAIVMNEQGRFVLQSEPANIIDPLGFLRGLLLETAMRASSRPPPSG
jgi:hypothetical protein